MFPNQIEEWIEARRPAVAAGLVGLVLLGLGMIWWRVGGREGDKIEIINADNAYSASNSAESKIKVDVAGAVAKPGVYELVLGARVGEAVEAAGGLTADADTSYVDMYLNRADKVKDGMKIYIPSITQNSKVKSQNRNLKVKSLVNINEASQVELEGLPEVGTVTAGKIIGGRPYGTVDELLERKVVGAKVFEQIKDLVSTW